MSYKIFIAYSGEDEQIANYIYDCLSKIVQFQPYKSENFPDFGTNFIERIKKEIRDSYCMVVLLTEKSINNQWVNQEVGYAIAMQERYGGKPYIIPISDSNLAIRLKGFISKDSVDILFMDKYLNWDYIIASIILFIRRLIPRGLEEGILNYKVKCQHCLDTKGLPFEYLVPIPEENVVRKIIEQNQNLGSACPQCRNMNYANILTFQPLEQ
jgi:hypothetical protein